MNKNPYIPRPPQDADERSRSRLSWLALGSLLGLWFWRKRHHDTGDTDADDQPGGPPAESQQRGHEPEDRASVRATVGFGVALLLMLGVVLAGMAGLIGLFEGDAQAPTPLPGAGFQQLPRTPHLQAAPALDLQQLYTVEDSLLNTYGWIDPDRGIVRLPIDRAMDLLAERGLPHDTTTTDSVMVLTESGYLKVPTYEILKPTSPAYRGHSPDK